MGARRLTREGSLSPAGPVTEPSGRGRQPGGWAIAVASACLAWGCAGGAAPGGGTMEGTTPRPTTLHSTIAADSLDPSLVPAGYGTLRQEDVAIRIQYLGMIARFLPLDESIIRLLAPDSYRALRDIQASKQDEIQSMTRRYSLIRPRLWYVSFSGLEQGETRFSPLELTVTSGGRGFRPVDAIALTPGFGEQRLGPRETQAALYLFDGEVNVDQALTLTFQTVRSTAWEGTLRRIERERSLVRSRVSRQPAPPGRLPDPAHADVAPPGDSTTGPTRGRSQ